MDSRPASAAAKAVLVQGDRVVAVGPIDTLNGAQTNEIDLGAGIAVRRPRTCRSAVGSDRGCRRPAGPGRSDADAGRADGAGGTGPVLVDPGRAGHPEWAVLRAADLLHRAGAHRGHPGGRLDAPPADKRPFVEAGAAAGENPSTAKQPGRRAASCRRRQSVEGQHRTLPGHQPRAQRRVRRQVDRCPGHRQAALDDGAVC